MAAPFVSYAAPRRGHQNRTKEEFVAIDEARQQGREATDEGAGKAQEVAAQAKEQVQQKADEVKAKASDRLREQLDSRSTQLGDQATSFGRAIRKSAELLDGEDNASGARAANWAADQVERVGGYLTDSDSSRFLGDLEDFGRQRPWAAGALGAGLGFVGARFLKASSESRYDTSYRSARDADLPISRDGGQTAAPSQAGAGDGD
jgi:gas vesicle protein